MHVQGIAAKTSRWQVSVTSFPHATSKPSVPMPVWALLLVAVAIVALVARRVGRMAAPAKPTIKAYDTTTGTYGPPPVEEPAASALRIHSTTVEPGTPALAGRDTAALTDLEDKIIRIMGRRSEEHTSELQSPCNLVCRLLLEKKKKQ